MTTTDLRTPAQRVEDARDKRRRELLPVLDWMLDAPDDVDSVFTTIIAARVGHEVDPDDMGEALAALRARTYEGTDEQVEAQDVRLDAALDVLLDLAECADCNGLHPADEVRVCDHGSFGAAGYPSCWTAFHAGRPCPSEHI